MPKPEKSKEKKKTKVCKVRVEPKAISSRNA